MDALGVVVDFGSDGAFLENVIGWICRSKRVALTEITCRMVVNSLFTPIVMQQAS